MRYLHTDLFLSNTIPISWVRFGETGLIWSLKRRGGEVFRKFLEKGDLIIFAVCRPLNGKILVSDPLSSHLTVFDRSRCRSTPLFRRKTRDYLGSESFSVSEFSTSLFSTASRKTSSTGESPDGLSPPTWVNWPRVSDVMGPRTCFPLLDPTSPSSSGPWTHIWRRKKEGSVVRNNRPGSDWR